jgi:hypothetical protein
LVGYVTGLVGYVTGLVGYVTGFVGYVTGFVGYVAGPVGNVIGWCGEGAVVAALAGRATPSRPTVIPAVARMVEGAFFISPL